MNLTHTIEERNGILRETVYRIREGIYQLVRGLGTATSRKKEDQYVGCIGALLGQTIADQCRDRRGDVASGFHEAYEYFRFHAPSWTPDTFNLLQKLVGLWEGAMVSESVLLEYIEKNYLSEEYKNERTGVGHATIS